MGGSWDMNYWTTLGNDIYAAYCYEPDSYVYTGGKIINSLTMAEEMKQALTRLSEWYELGYIDPEFPTSNYDKALGQFNSGRLLSLFGWNWGQVVDVREWSRSPVSEAEFYTTPYGWMVAANSEASMEIANWPRGEDGWTGGNAIFTPYRNVRVISTTMAKDEERWQKYLQILSDSHGGDDDIFMLIFFGKEGISYDPPVAGQPVQVRDEFLANNNKLLNEEGIRGFFYQHFGKYVERLYTELVNDMGIYDYREAVWDTYDVPYYIDAKNILPIPSALLREETTDLELIWKKAFNEIIMGRESVSHYDEMLKLWLESGGQARIDFYNENALKFYQ